ncbi:MAG: ATP-dependent DNA helicase RecG [Candidatus Jorgensenbacteria bacterium]|nr:ATP-dependent DNA helicase RecG [Candidatus Jorgensenbacteria bacterium]
MPSVTPDMPLSAIQGIAPRFLAKLERLKIRTIRDLLYHFPFRYEDYSHVYRISELQPNQDATIQGEIQDVSGRKTWHRTYYVTEALIADGEDSIRAVWWNQPYLRNTLKPGVRANFSGKVSVGENGELYLSNPAFELTREHDTHDPTHTARIVPIYPETAGLTSKGIRFLVRPLLDAAEVEEFLPEEVLTHEGLPPLSLALRHIHFPDELADAESARKRFAFEDLFLLELANIGERARLKKERAPAIALSEKRHAELLKILPFMLTNSQTNALEEILTDLARPHPMNRLLQGDVGSGKTVVAAIAGRATAEAGYQTAFMAPTEILARQHYETLKKFWVGFEGGVALLTGSEARLFLGDGLEACMKKSELQTKIRRGNVAIVIGTHALIEKGVGFPRLALVIVDEQHRFGVEQRAALVKDGAVPHFLSMSATPIPRTLALTLFGNLDLSLITELPKDRKAIVTKVVSPEDRLKAYAFIKEFVRRGRQVFVICPRIEKSQIEHPEALDPRTLSMLEMKNVTEEYEKLSKKIFPDLRVTMLHGKLKAKEKAEIMKRFTEGTIDILVSTSVVEVGVDVPNATVMMVESAERFGLAQLYQFRGRVGRGAHQSFCFLFTETLSAATKKRLEAVARAKNGFELAEEDLKLRGPGEFLGTTQTGMPDLAMKALQHPTLVPKARTAAETLTAKDPSLSAHPALKKRLDAFTKAIHFE